MRRLRLAIRNSHPSQAARTTITPIFSNMNESVSEQPLSPKVAAFVGIDWADQKHDVVLRSADDPAKSEHQIIKSEINALNDWIAQMQERFEAKGKVLVCLEQSRGALIYQLMAYELFELYPINPSQLANYRKTFFSSGAKDDRPDADLLSELLMCHRDRLKAWKPDDQLTRELASLNEGRRNAVDRRTELANEIKSQLKAYCSTVALQILAIVTLHREVSCSRVAILDNAGTLNGNVGGAPASRGQSLTRDYNGNVQLAGATDTVQLFTGSKINGNLGLSGTTSSTLILDGVGQQLLSLAVTGTVTNNGTLVKQGSSTWTIDRALDAPLGTDILAGTLIVEAVLTTAQVNVATGAVLQLNSGGSVGNLVVDGSLIFANSGTVNHSEVISGPGNVIQNGTGTTILSGKNTYSGGTIIDLGTLLVNNPQALGTGNVIVNGGVLGADPQPINVQGNYTQNAGGTLQLNIAGRAPGQYDVLNVGGNASLNGTLRLLNLGYQPKTATN